MIANVRRHRLRLSRFEGSKGATMFRLIWTTILMFGGLAAAGLVVLRADPPQATVSGNPARLDQIGEAKTPAIDRPVMFDTPEADAICSALEMFPPDNALKLVVEDWPVHPNSKAIVASVGADKPLRYNTDMAFVLVPPDQKRVPVKIVEYPDESDPGPYPVPDNVPIEGWPVNYQREGSNLTLSDVQRRPEKYEGDRHAIVVDPVNGTLYEFFTFGRTPGGWAAGQASVFDLKSNKLRPEGWTSADAAGLPIFPTVIRHDELKRGMVGHAMRVTVRRTQRAYIPPATHFASQLTDEDLPRMGERFRLRKDFDASGFSRHLLALRCLVHHQAHQVVRQREHGEFLEHSFHRLARGLRVSSWS